MHVNSTYYHSCNLMFALTMCVTYFDRVSDILCMHSYLVYLYHVPFHEECLQHHGNKRDPGMTPETCGPIGERDQVILVWWRALVV